MNYSIDKDFGLQRRTKWAIIGLGAIAMTWGTAIQAEAQYFKGKTIEVIVPAGAGGGLTRNARRFVQNFGKHIAGNPTVIIKNMVGGGGQRGINHVYQNGKKDGTTLMWGPLNLAGIVAGLRGIKYDPAKFTTIGGAGGLPFVTIVTADLNPGIKVPSDIMKAGRFISGGRIPGGALGMYSIMSFDILGLNYKHVTGYRNQPKLKAALMGKEIKTLTTGAPGYYAFYANDLLKKKTATALFYHPSLDSKTGKPNLATGAYGKNVKSLAEFHQDVKGSVPSGDKWEAYKWYSTYMIWPNTLVAAPGTDPKAAAVLRKAYRANWNDPVTKASFRKALGSDSLVLVGEEMNSVFNNFRKISPPALAYLRSALGLGTKKKGGKKKK